MLKRNRITSLVVLSLMVSILLSACGPSADTTVPATSASSATTAAATTAAGTTAASGATTAATSGTDIRIGLMGPFTGGSASLGLAIKRGATMAANDINNAGGINGRKIVLIERDDQATPNTGVTNIKDLIDKEKVLAVFGTANTAVGVVQAPIVQQSKIPWLIPVTTGTKITEEPGTPSYIFRLSMVDRYQTQFVADYVTSKYKKIALINDDSGYGTLGRDDVLARFKEKNISLVAEPITYKVAGTPDDMVPMINRLKELAPEVVINWGLGPAAANIKKAMKQVNADFQMVGSWGLSMPEFPNVAQGLENGTLVAQTFSVDTTNQKQFDFINRYKAEYKTDRVDFPSGAAQAFDLMHILGEALKQPGAADDRDKLRVALANFGTYDGVIKSYSNPFKSPTQDAFTDKDFFFTVWKDGKLVKLDNK